MDKRGLEPVEVSFAEKPLQTCAAPPLRVLPPPSAVAIRSEETKPVHVRTRRRSRRVLNFIVLELSALALLTIILLVGTSRTLARPGLTLPFTAAIIVAGTLVVAVPVFFFGLPRQRSPYHRRRSRR